MSKAIIRVIAAFVLMLYAPTSLQAQTVQPSKSQPSEQAKEASAVVLVYHRFGEDRYPTTNIRLVQFEEQLAFLKAEGFHFLDLKTFTHHMVSQTPFPDKSLMITVDDAYRSAMTEAWPRLKALGIPLTIFVATEAVEAKRPGYLTWDDLRSLQKEGVAIGHHGHSHLHMVHTDPQKTQQDLDKATALFTKELGASPKVFAYPYGEYSKDIRGLVAKQFDLAFAQFSGAASIATDLMTLPRYAINERYGSLSRFTLVSQSRALPVSEVIPADPYLQSEKENPPLVGFTLPKRFGKATGLTCYPSHLNGKPASILRPAPGRFEVRFTEKLPKGRSRINCTLMGPNKRWYWFSRYFLVPGGTLD